MLEKTDKERYKQAKFTIEFFEEICKELSTTIKGVNTICKEKNLHEGTFYDWLKLDQERPNEERLGLTERYTQAKEHQANYFNYLAIETAFTENKQESEVKEFDENGNEVKKTIRITDGVERDKLKINALQWSAARLYPVKYGNKVDLTTQGGSITPKVQVSDAETAAKLKEIDEKFGKE